MAPRTKPTAPKIEEFNEVPELTFSENTLPSVLNVEHKKTGQQFQVNSKYFVANQATLQLV